MVKYVKFLGDSLDEHLSWKYDSAKLSKKLAKNCDILFRVRHLLPKTTLITLLYNAFLCLFYNMALLHGDKHLIHI